LEALAALGPASRAALPDLRRLAKIRPLEPLIRRGAALAIWSIGRDADESLPMLLPLVAEPRFDEPSGCSMTPADMAAFVRPVFEALVETGRPEAVPALAEAALSADPRIRRAAVAALATGRFGRAAAAALPVLMGRVADETDPAVRRAAAEAIARLPTAGGRGPGVSGSRWAGP
jgi:HEAT repeat protein